MPRIIFVPANFGACFESDWHVEWQLVTYYGEVTGALCIINEVVGLMS